MKIIANRLQAALDIIDSIDTYRQSWMDVDEALHRVVGQILDAQEEVRLIKPHQGGEPG